MNKELYDSMIDPIMASYDALEVSIPEMSQATQEAMQAHVLALGNCTQTIYGIRDTLIPSHAAYVDDKLKELNERVIKFGIFTASLLPPEFHGHHA